MFAYYVVWNIKKNNVLGLLTNDRAITVDINIANAGKTWRSSYMLSIIAKNRDMLSPKFDLMLSAKSPGSKKHHELPITNIKQFKLLKTNYNFMKWKSGILL